MAKAGLALDELELAFTNPTTAAVWARVHERVQAGEMPPAHKPRPVPAQVDAALGALHTNLLRGEQQRRATDGRATTRRLNRSELEHTLRDLLDLPGLSIKDLLPDDGRIAGYDKSAAALDVSPIFLAQYAAALDRALNLAIAPYSVPPEVERRTMYLNQQYDSMVLLSGGDNVMLKEQQYDASRFPLPSGDEAIPYPNGKWQYGGKYKNLGEAHRAGVFKEPATVGMTRTIDEANGYRFNFAPLHPGKYRISVSAWSYWWNQGKVEPAPRSGAIGIYVGSRLLGHFDAPSLKAAQSEVTTWIDPKPREPLKINPASLWNVHVYFSKGQIARYVGPGVALDWLAVEGPLHDEWPPPSHRRLFGNLRIAPLDTLPTDVPKPVRQRPQQSPDGANGPGRLVFGTVVSESPGADATRLLSDFLPRAFRRPVTASEVASYTARALDRIGQGACFEDAMKAAYKAALLSPDFLFLREPVGPLDDHALAARLAYFLWNSLPDDALTALANAGRLREPAVLQAQTERLLQDAKAQRFVADFLDQWLDLRDFDATTPDRTLYPEFTPYLEDAMRREPREFLAALLRENQPAPQLVNSSINVVNQRLAEHYGLAGVSGTQFRRVITDPQKVPRGGLLTMAAVLKVTANGTTTTPVKRGAWVLRKILGTPPQPPPPDIPAVEPDVKGATTIRELLAKHRDHAACASCHRRMDPPGFALESFDPIGGFRTHYRSTKKGTTPDLTALFPSFRNAAGQFQPGYYHVGFRTGLPVDSSGTTAEGQAFADVLAYRQLLTAQPRPFVRNVAAQLVTYATGAPVGYADRAAVEQIVTQTEGYKLRTLIHTLVQSALFTQK
jgi:hypothetical protein